MRTEIFSADFVQLDSIREFVGQAARDADMGDVEIYHLQMAVDEACSNIIEHAYAGMEAGDIECTCVNSDVGLTVILRDHGKPFAPSLVPEPDLSADLLSRRVGGVGLHIIRSLMDEVMFEQLGESGNVLTMVKYSRRAE
ncbi:MAG: ATP-binding protein [Chloroflexota bacterium]